MSLRCMPCLNQGNKKQVKSSYLCNKCLVVKVQDVPKTRAQFRQAGARKLLLVIWEKMSVKSIDGFHVLLVRQVSEAFHIRRNWVTLLPPVTCDTVTKLQVDIVDRSGGSVFRAFAP